VVLCKSLGRGVPLECRKPRSLLDHDQLDFTTLHSRVDTKNPLTYPQLANILNAKC